MTACPRGFSRSPDVSSFYFNYYSTCLIVICLSLSPIIKFLWVGIVFSTLFLLESNHWACHKVVMQICVLFNWMKQREWIWNDGQFKKFKSKDLWGYSLINWIKVPGLGHIPWSKSLTFPICIAQKKYTNPRENRKVGKTPKEFKPQNKKRRQRS
jgi:hypothetical protein